MSEEIRFLVEQYYDIQELRKKAFNNIVAYVRQEAEAGRKFVEERKGGKAYAEIAESIAKGEIKAPEIENLVWYFNRLMETEKELRRRLDLWSSAHPLRVKFLNKIRGIGPVLSSALIAWLSPISRFPTVSKLWAYCGLSAIHYECECEEGHKFMTTSKPDKCKVMVKKGNKMEQCGAKVVSAVRVESPPKRKEGYAILINNELRTLCWKIAREFEFQKPEKSYYRRVYEEAKKKYEAKGGTKLHIRNRALRYTVKRFLADLWVVWRQLEGLPVRKPYVIDELGHRDYEPPHLDQ